MSNDSVTQQEVHEVDISYSHDILLDKLIKHGLNKKNIFAKVDVDLFVLTSNYTDIADSKLSMLFKEIEQWQPKQNVELFTSNINQLIFLWLTAMEDGATTHNILSLLKSFKIKSAFGASSSSKFHLFLFGLVAETVSSYQKLSLQYVQNYDTNTLLPNTKLIDTDLKRLLNNATNDSSIGIFSIFFQASRNKLTFSRKIALQFNKKIAVVLKENIGENNLLYLEGDSAFDILIPDTNLTKLNLLSAKISRAFEEMLTIENQSTLMTPFIGCAITSSKTEENDNLHDNSKLALESAIERQITFAFYDDNLQKSLVEKRIIENKVIEAFGADNLTLHFQPILNLKDSKCVGAELLLRWSEKAHYSVYPNVTVEILNKVGKGKLFTRWLINSACRYASELKYDHNLTIYLTLNLRAEDLYDIELPYLLEQAVKLWKIKPEDIILEITENGILEYNENSNSIVNQLAELGFKFALDDFGTGYSSLTRLRNMPIDLIKIDQSFVKDISNSKDDFEIVQSIALLARSLGKEVLAEGIEDKDCLSNLTKLKIDKGQGYYFSRPIPFEEFVDWVKLN